MASLSLSRWSTKIAADSSTAELSKVPATNCSIFSSCHVKRHSFSPSALRNSSSFCSFNSGPRRKNWIDSDVCCSKRNDVVHNAKDDVTSVSSGGAGAQKRQALSVKSLFGRRSLWRRILFASKRVRSVILLNVITIVYGKLVILFYL